jgi:hypothetical protein
MVLDLFAVCLLVLGLGLVLGYLLAMPRVKVLEKELSQAKGSVQDLPQHQNSYWRFEGPKLQKKVLDLEMELESIRSKTLWKQD